MNITIQHIELDEQCEDMLIGIVPFRSFPVCSVPISQFPFVQDDKKYKLRPFNPEEHPFWAWVTYKEVEPFKISPDKESFSSIIDVTLLDVEQFAVDYDEIRITFADGTSIYFELPIERYSKIAIDGTY